MSYSKDSDSEDTPLATMMNEGETLELRPGFTKTCLRKGSGVKPEDGNLCVMHYHGTLDDGQTFDSTRHRGPFRFHVGMAEVIKGWDIAVATMSVGEKALLHIPYLYVRDCVCNGAERMRAVCLLRAS